MRSSFSVLNITPCVAENNGNLFFRIHVVGQEKDKSIYMKKGKEKTYVIFDPATFQSIKWTAFLCINIANMCDVIWQNSPTQYRFAPCEMYFFCHRGMAK